METNCIFIYSNFVVIHPQISIVSVFKIASFPVLIPNKIFHVTVVLIVYFAINLWHWKFTADITAVFVNNQHGIQC